MSLHTSSTGIDTYKAESLVAELQRRHIDQDREQARLLLIDLLYRYPDLFTGDHASQTPDEDDVLRHYYQTKEFFRFTEDEVQ